jgi:DHA2 family multidrug resistance protein-like MFS transporter
MYRGRMAKAILDGIPAEVRKAAQETLGGAAAAAEHLAEPVRAQLLAASREAFTHALEQTAAICALVAAATAVTSVVLLRRVRTAADSERRTEPVANTALAG